MGCGHPGQPAQASRSERYAYPAGVITRCCLVSTCPPAPGLTTTAQFARRVRKRLGFTQHEFARRINVPQETIRNWEQGKRRPPGAAKALLRVLDKAPETAQFVLR